MRTALSQIVHPALKRPPHHCNHTPSIVQELHKHSQAVACVIVFVLTSLNEQCHFVHEYSVFLAAVGVVNKKELFYIRCELDYAAQLALRGGRFFLCSY